MTVAHARLVPGAIQTAISKLVSIATMRTWARRMAWVCAAWISVAPALASAQVRVESWDGATSLEGTWRYRVGDDPSWADPELDDSDWAETEVPDGERPPEDTLGHSVVWYRLHIELSDVARALRRLGKGDILDVGRGDATARTMTVLFADIRGFTALSERLGPERTFAFMNEYHSAVGPEISRAGGFINQYYGDGIMALFDEADAALDAALAMRSALGRFNANREDPIEVGIGLHTGDVMLGTIGDAERLDTGVIGDAVNAAARIQDLTKEHQRAVLISGATRDALTDPPVLQEVGEVVLRGRSAPTVLLSPVLSA